jgi:hypothetical protein
MGGEIASASQQSSRLFSGILRRSHYFIESAGPLLRQKHGVGSPTKRGFGPMRIVFLIFATCVSAVAAVPHITPGQSASVAVAGSTSLTGTDFGTKKERSSSPARRPK